MNLPSNNRIVHDWLVRLVLEVAVPSRTELWAWPFVHCSEFFFGGSDLHTCLNTVGSKWASAIDIPLVKHLFLNMRISTHKIVERLSVRSCTEHAEGQVVVLEVQTDTRKVD